MGFWYGLGLKLVVSVKFKASLLLELVLNLGRVDNHVNFLHIQIDFDYTGSHSKIHLKKGTYNLVVFPGTGALASNLLEVLDENRGSTYFTGGDGDWRSCSSIYNFIRNYNYKVKVRYYQTRG